MVVLDCFLKICVARPERRAIANGCLLCADWALQMGDAYCRWPTGNAQVAGQALADRWMKCRAGQWGEHKWCTRALIGQWRRVRETSGNGMFLHWFVIGVDAVQTCKYHFVHCWWCFGVCRDGSNGSKWTALFLSKRVRVSPKCAGDVNFSNIFSDSIKPFQLKSCNRQTHLVPLLNIIQRRTLLPATVPPPLSRLTSTTSITTRHHPPVTAPPDAE